MNIVMVNGHKVSQVVCLNCYRRWISARPVDTILADLECPDCGMIGNAIETGETSITEELLKKAMCETEGIPEVIK